MTTETIVRGHELFSSLSPDEIDMLSTFSSRKTYAEGETLFEFNQSASHFFMLMKGLVYLELPANPPEFSVAISKVEKGELFGISPLLDSRRYTCAARCYEPSKVLSVEAAPFRRLLRTNRTAGLDIINKVARIYFARYIDMIRRLQDAVSPVSLRH